MKQPDKGKGPGGGAPEPQTIALQAIAQSLYSIPLDTGNRKGQSIAIPRSVIELAIELAIDWLDLMDRLAPSGPNGSQVPENAL